MLGFESIGCITEDNGEDPDYHFSKIQLSWRFFKIWKDLNLCQCNREKSLSKSDLLSASSLNHYFRDVELFFFSIIIPWNWILQLKSRVVTDGWPHQVLILVRSATIIIACAWRRLEDYLRIRNEFRDLCILSGSTHLQECLPAFSCAKGPSDPGPGKWLEIHLKFGGGK